MTTAADFSVLMWPEKSWRFNEMAEQVAPVFGLREPKFTLVGDIEGYRDLGGILANVKFKTIISDSQYLLTIYYAFSGTPDPSAFDRRLAFMYWADHLEEHGIQVPVKIPDLNGDLVCKATINLSNGTSVQCASVLDAWIEGDALEETEADLAEIAELMARMHTVSEGWTYPPGLGDRFDHSTLLSSQAMIQRPFEDARVSVEYQDLVEETFRKVIEHVSILPQNEELWGPCHLDLDIQNCLRIPGDISPIDFDASGLAFFAFDIALVLEGYPPKLREIFLSSYQKHRRLAEDIQQILETFILMYRLRVWMSRADLSHDVVRRPDNFKWAPEWVSREFDLYVNGKPFLFEQDPPSIA